MNRSLTRREFVKASLGASTLLAFSATVPGFLSRTVRAATQSRRRDTVLVVLQLSGGNDGLNTVVPYEDPAYHRSRPTLCLTAERVHPITSGLGLHPEMSAFLRLYREGRLSIVQGVGYPHSKRDHEEAMRDWHTAKPTEEAGGRSRETDEIAQSGWLGRAINGVYETKAGADLPGAFVGPIKAPFSLQTERAVVPSVRSLDQWAVAAEPNPGALGQSGRSADILVREDHPPGLADRNVRAPAAAWEASLTRMARFSRAGAVNPLLEFAQQVTLEACAASQRLQAVVRNGSGTYPQLPLAQTLKTVAQLIRAELGIRIYCAELGGGGIGGFDTHAGQAANHGALLRELSESVAAFLDDLRRDGLLDSVLLMTFSEFGRTLAENGRRGTGHGAAAPLFLAGGGLEGGVVGAHPSLTDLDGDAPKFHTDFRRVYATVLDRWLGLNSEAILGEQFKPLEQVVKRSS